MSLRFDPDRKLVHIELTGSLDPSILLSTLDLIVAHEEYEPGMARVWDFRNADLSTLTTNANADLATLATNAIAEMARYSSGLPSGFGDVKVAFLADRPLEFGLSRMFGAYTRDENSRIGVFRTFEEILDWLAD